MAGYAIMIMASVVAAASEVTCPNGDTYHDITVYLFHALQKRLVKFYQHEPADELKFSRILSQAYLRLSEDHPLINPVRQLLRLIPAGQPVGLKETARINSLTNELRMHTIDHCSPQHYSPPKRQVFQSADGLKRSLQVPSQPASTGLYSSLRSRVDYVHSIKEQLHPPKLRKFMEPPIQPKRPKLSPSKPSQQQQQMLKYHKQASPLAEGGSYIGQRRLKNKPNRRQVGF